MPYKFLEHTADVKFQASGSSIEEAFISAAEALNETIRGKIKILEQEEKEIKTAGKDLEALLYNFLEEFIYLLDAECFLVNKIKSIEINQENFTLKATLLGDKATNYKFTNDVKAVTYSQMFVKKEKNKFTVQAVLDV